ncbi:MAG: 3-phosphoshikimate 1-carboxyvinyltransferase [Desulfovibrionaceae bacterium]|nr:3-phosphoshikimate 1-carboxyvinyltransferase [Desulfovibrionaceae bacterium]
MTQTDAISINIPGSKSLSHRYLIGAALASGRSTIMNCQKSSDVQVTRSLLTKLGARILEEDDTTLVVEGIAGNVRGGEGSPMDCDVGESGTSCRLLAAVFAAGNGLFRVFGKGRMHKRPIEELCAALTRLGAGIVYTETSGNPPFLLQARGLNPDLVKGELAVGMDASSQYFSGLLLASPLCPSPLSLELGGTKAVSWPYVGLTLQCLHDFGISFTVETRKHDKDAWSVLEEGNWREVALVKPGCLRITVTPAPYRAGTFTLEGDWSNASYFLAAGALGKRPVHVCGLSESSLQGDRIFLEILAKMGAHFEYDASGVTVFPSELHGVDLDMGSCPDLVQTVSVLAAFAQGSTRIHNVAHLRFKETDRLAAPCLELKKIGVVIDTLSDGLLISGRGGKSHTKRGASSLPTLPEGTCFSAHNDHRMAMSLAILDCVNPDLAVQSHIDNPNVVDKSFPTFWEKWQCLLK